MAFLCQANVVGLPNNTAGVEMVDRNAVLFEHKHKTCVLQLH